MNTQRYYQLSTLGTQSLLFLKKKDFTYLFLERGEGREKERERNINVWLPVAHPLLGTWPATQACALTRNQTSDPLVRRPARARAQTSKGFLCSISWSNKLNRGQCSYCQGKCKSKQQILVKKFPQCQEGATIPTSSSKASRENSAPSVLSPSLRCM